MFEIIELELVHMYYQNYSIGRFILIVTKPPRNQNKRKNDTDNCAASVSNLAPVGQNKLLKYSVINF